MQLGDARTEPFVMYVQLLVSVCLVVQCVHYAWLKQVFSRSLTFAISYIVLLSSPSVTFKDHLDASLLLP